MKKAELDPSQSDGLYFGPSRGHVQQKYAQLIGLPRAYGYGASMGAWCLDYIGNWGGEWSDIIHSKVSYRTPAMTGDLTLNGVTKPVTLDLEGPSTTINARGKTISGFSASGVLKRSDFSFGTKDLPPMLGDEVKLVIDVEIDKQ